jgi:galactoside O-acetyltransferase
MRRFGINFLVQPEDRCYVRIGRQGFVNAQITFESAQGSVTLGDRVYCGAGTSIISRAGVTIGNDVTMAWGVVIYDHNSHSFDWRQRARVVEHFYASYGTPECFEKLDWTDVKSAPIVIQDRVWLGFNVVVLKGVTIGEGAVVGAGSVVAMDVEPYSVVAGNPARVVKRLERQKE